MKKSTKKGFTLVELVIVIAVIAVLSAIIIPVTSSVVSNAKETVDKTTVKALNTALSQDEAKNGARTLYSDVVDAMAEYGYGVDKLTPLSLGDILWDSKSNTFVLYKDGKEVMREKGSSLKDKEKILLWRVAKNQADLSTEYSNYLADNFDNKTVSVKTGVDVGNNKVEVEYIRTTGNAQSVIFNTNGGGLTVDAPNDNVNHYGSASYVNIAAVANNSYHEFGMADEIKLKKGRTVIEKSGKVGSVMVTATTVGDIEIVNNDGTIGGVAANDSDVATALKSKVTGVDESKVLTYDVDNSKFAAGLGTEEAPYLISTAEQFKNIVQGKHYKLINDINTSKIVTCTDYGQNYTAIIDSLQDSVLDGNNYKVTILDSSLFLFRFYNSTIKNIKISLKNNLVYYGSFSTFENVDVEGTITTTGGNEGIYLIYCEPKGSNAKMTFIDCDCSATFTSDGTGSSYNAVFTGYAYPDKTTILNYTNCTYSGTFISGKTAMFLGNNSANKGSVTINVSNCENKGIIQATIINSNYNFNSYLATGIKADSTDKSYINNTVILNGNQLTAEKISGPLSTGFVQGPNDKSLKLKQNSDGTFTVTQSDNTNVAYYIVSVSLYSKYKEGGTLVQGVNEKVDNNAFVNNTYVTALKRLRFVDKAWVDNNKTATSKTFGTGNLAYTIYTLNDNEYYYLPNNTTATLDGKISEATLISVSCYDSNGKLLASTAVTK